MTTKPAAAPRPSQVFVDTTSYRATYGREPRGYGSWAFYFVNPNFARGASPVWVTGSRTYTEARKIARQMACDQGVDIIYAAT
jgi:hypothetical protein